MRRVMTIGVVIIILLAMFGRNVLAQDDTIPLPNIDALFADNVEVVDVGLVPDNAVRVVYHYGENGWGIVPFSEGMPDYLSPMLPQSESVTGGGQIWVWDAETAQFRRYDGSCGVGAEAWLIEYAQQVFWIVDWHRLYFEVQQERLELLRPLNWVFTGDHFCSLETGEVGPELPSGLGPLLDSRYSIFVSISPSGAHVVLVGEYQHTPEPELRGNPVYSYQFATGELVLLGTFGCIPDWGQKE